MVTCTFEGGCDREVSARDLCYAHYRQQLRGIPLRPIARRGFAGMVDVAYRREIAQRGGRAAHAKGTGHEWTSSEARRAGAKGGLIRAARRYGWTTERLTAELTRRGLR